MRPLVGIGILWIAWIAVWAISAIGTNPTEKTVSLREEAPYRILTIVSAALIISGSAHTKGLMGIAGWSMAAIVALGLGFSIWARWHLGPLWSANVTKKADHRLIATGPYAFVRHPIYTGVIAALWAMAVAQTRWEAILGAAIFTISFIMKARLEEKFLRLELGPSYDVYAADVPMLIPFWPRTG